jgi:hypothetical protein
LALTFGGHTEGRVEQERAVEGLWRTKGVDEQEEKGDGSGVIPDFGRCVVLEGRQAAARGDNGKPSMTDLSQGIRSPFLIFVSPEESTLLVGGWID